jgi:hypothetical protein
MPHILGPAGAPPDPMPPVKLAAVCTCDCHDCCVPQWAGCDECDDNHDGDYPRLPQEAG